MTTAKTILQLNTYDFDNLDRLTAATGQSRSEAFHQALAFCDTAVDYMRRGYCISAFYREGHSRCTTATFSPVRAAQSINARRKDVEMRETSLALYRATADRLENIKRFLKVDSDTLAVAFALEFSRHALDTTQRANDGKTATIFFSRDNHPGKSGYLLNKQHPYNANTANSFRRAVRRSKQKLAEMNPFTRKPATPALPAPAPAAEAPSPATAPEAPMQEIRLLKAPTINKRLPGNKNSGSGFNL